MPGILTATPWRTGLTTRRPAWLAAILTGLILSGCARVPRQPTNHGIPDYGEVAPGIHRGGQPTPEGWRWLAGAGVKTSIKLNEEWLDPEDEAIAAGLAVVRCPIDLVHQTLAEPERANLERALSAIENRQPCFVHCCHGMDRTGLVVYLYRLRHGWTTEAAQTEALAYGFHKELNGLWRVMAPPGPLRSPKDQP